jgi:hypothetical protein
MTKNSRLVDAVIDKGMTNHSYNGFWRRTESGVMHYAKAKEFYAVCPNCGNQKLIGVFETGETFSETATWIPDAVD